MQCRSTWVVCGFQPVDVTFFSNNKEHLRSEETMEYIIFVAILFLIPFWRIFKRAGLNEWLSLLVLIPFIGVLIALIVLAESTWRVKSTTEV